jgi:hypothetical protein
MVWREAAGFGPSVQGTGGSLMSERLMHWWLIATPARSVVDRAEPKKLIKCRLVAVPKKPTSNLKP